MIKDKNKQKCSEIIGEWKFSKESINKMNEMAERTRTIEHGGVLCGNDETKKIDLKSECEGDVCAIYINPNRECPRLDLIPIGDFHTHPSGKLKPSPSDLKLLHYHLLECIGTSRAKDGRVLCFKPKYLNHKDELNRNKKLEDIIELRRRVKTSDITPKELDQYRKGYRDLLGKYYYNFDPSKCVDDS